MGGNYGATDAVDWSGTILGGIPIVNNPVDVPQYWGPVGLAQKLQALSNWPANLRTKVIRSYGAYLIAINLIDTGTALPHTIQWSHPSDPGGLPISWDYTDPTRDAGRKDFPDTESGVLVDAKQLQGVVYLYKEGSVWRMTVVGGRGIFDFKSFLETAGCLGHRCVAVTGDGLRHVVATQDDIIWHNGNQVASVLNKKQRRRLFNEIDTQNFKNSFMFCIPTRFEMWFCYPGSGQIEPDRALVLNYAEQEWRVTEADGISFRAAASGNLEATQDVTWDAHNINWDDDTEPWSTLVRRRVIAASPTSTKFFNLDKGILRDGVAFACTLQREGLSIVGKDRNGNPIEDHQVVKLIGPLWPKVQGGPIRIRVGKQETVNGVITWGPYVAFDPATQVHADVAPISGRATGVEFSTILPATWRLDGYKYNVEQLGMF